MDMNAWIKEVKEAEAEVASLSDKQVRALVRHLFATLKTRIEGTEEGSIKLAAFGQFKISKAERKKDGVATPVKRVMFRLSKPAAEGKTKGKGEGKGKGAKKKAGAEAATA